MRNEIQSRLHQVMIKLDKKEIICLFSLECLNAENCSRYNIYYRQCTKFSDFLSESNEEVNY
jgi:hypothetical protein